jgi:hypothetical protein
MKGTFHLITIPHLVHCFSLVLRERYLRDDISCGVDGCRACNATAQTVLPRSGDTTHKDFPTGHYILPDTNVFLAQVCTQVRGCERR